VSQEEVSVVCEAIAAFNSGGGVEAALQYLDPNIEWIGPPEWLEDRVYEGHDGMRKLASLWTEQFDEYRLDLDRTIDAGDHVLALLHQRGRIKGSADEIEQPIGYDCEVRNGKWARVHIYFSWEDAFRTLELDQ
jgi:ketosteroid isomerase-like protein